MATDWITAKRAEAAARRAGDVTAGVELSSGTSESELKKKIDSAQTAKEVTSQSSSSDTISSGASVEDQIAALNENQLSYASKMADAIRSQTKTRQEAYDKIFGEGSSIASFYNPSLAAIEQSIATITQDIRKLPKDILAENKDVGITTAQERRIEAKRLGELSDTLANYTSSYEALTAGRDAAIQMGKQEYEMLLANAEDEMNATLTEVEALNVLNSTQLSELKTQLEDKLKTEKDTKESVDKILEDARNLIYEAGITPTAAFDKVVSDAYAMASSGASIAEIQNGIFKALESNPAIKEYIAAKASKDLYGKKKSGSSSSSDGSGLSDAELDLLFDSGEGGMSWSKWVQDKLSSKI